MAFNFFKKKSVGAGGTGGAGRAAGGTGEGGNPPGGGVASPPGTGGTGGNGGDGGSSGALSGGFKPDPKSAAKWFDHARAVADSRQYDYAITCYCSGLKFDPDNMIQHEALRDVALRRRVNGGKPAPIGEKIKSGGKTAVDRMLHAEKIWSMEPLSLSLMLAVMERAVDADHAEPELNLAEFANWVGDFILEGPRDKPPKKSDLVKVRDLYRAIHVYDRAIHAAQALVNLDRTDIEQMTALRDIETEKSLRDSQERSDVRKAGEFTKNVVNMDEQRATEFQERSSRTESQADIVIGRRRADADADPDDIVKRDKLGDALRDKETDESQGEAAKLYQALFEKTKQYLYKDKAGDVRIKILKRHAQVARKAAETAPNDPKAAQDHKDKIRKLREYELEEFTERAKNYPTEMDPKFRVGELLFYFERYDEAIGVFQQTKSNPKMRALSQHYLGRCFEFQEWFDEAISAYTEAINVYPLPNDNKGSEMRYHLMNALEQAARKSRNVDQAREALKWGSQILQNNINYKDIKERMERIRKLITEIGAGKSEGAAAESAGSPDT